MRRQGHDPARLLAALAAAAGVSALAACTIADGRAGACAPGDGALAGHYVLNGVMEVGSELLLRPDGSFTFMLAYGANDQFGQGCWRRDGQTVSLVPAGRGGVSGRHTPDSRGFSGMALTVERGGLVWDIAGSGHRGRYVRT